MIQYKTLNSELSNLQLTKLRSRTENGTKVEL